MFTSKYKPGTPISDPVRKLKYQFDEEKNAKPSDRPRPRSTRCSRVISGQGGGAEDRELVAGPPSDGFNWWLLSVAGMGAAVLASLTLLWMQRRGG